MKIKSYFENKNVEDGTRQISWLLNDKCRRNFKLTSPIIIQTGHFCIVVMPQVYIKPGNNNNQVNLGGLVFKLCFHWQKFAR